MEGFLAGQETSLRNQVLGRYPGFLQSLLQSPSPEVQVLCQVAAADPSSTPRQNIEYVKQVSGVDPMRYGAACVAASLPTSQVPEEQQWRLGLLTSLLALRQEKYLSQEDSSRVEAMLASLCSTQENLKLNCSSIKQLYCSTVKTALGSCLKSFVVTLLTDKTVYKTHMKVSRFTAYKRGLWSQPLVFFYLCIEPNCVRNKNHDDKFNKLV